MGKALDGSRVVRVCYAAGQEPGAFRRNLLAQIGRVVTTDAAFFATCDPETLLFTSAWADPVLATEGARFLDNEFGEERDVNRFASLAEASRPVATLDEATSGDRRQSRRYVEIMAPLRLGDELRVALRAGKTTWGFLCLHREDGTGFSSHEAELLERVAPHAAEAIARMVLDGVAADRGPHIPATVLVEDGEVVALTPAAETMLDGHLAIGAPLPLPLHHLIRRLESIESGASRESCASLTMVAPNGAVEVHAARMTDRAVALTLTRASPSARSCLLLSAHGLTPAQKRVTALVLRGFSTREIVRELRISEHTVQDHLKAVFEKLGVSTRRELVAELAS